MQKPHSVRAVEKRVSIESEQLPVMLRQFPRTMKRQMLIVENLCCVDLEFCPCALIFGECHVRCRLQTGNCVAVYKSFDLNSDKENSVTE
jgi:hypothetical protein